MALQGVPGYFGKVGFQHPMTLLRNFNEALFRQSGAIRYGDWSLTPIAGLNLSVGPGTANVIGPETDQKQGSYFVWSELAETLAWPLPSGSPRIDALIVRIHDDDYGSITGLPRCEWEIVQGTPSGSPVIVPDSAFAVAGGNYVPGAWWRVANVRIEPSDTTINPANVTNALGTTVVTGASQFCYAPRHILTAGTPTGGVAGDTGYDYVNASPWRNIAGVWTPNDIRRRYLGTDMTQWISDTTLDDITNMTWAGLPINSVWRIEGRLMYICGTGLLKVGWTGPSGFAIDWTTTGWNAGGSFVGIRIDTATTPAFSGGGHTGVGTIDNLQVEGIVTIGGTAGTLQLKGAQNASSVQGTQIKAFTAFNLERIS